MKLEACEIKKEFGKDLKTFEHLPAKTQELELLKDRAEKSIGPEKAALDAVIRAKPPTHPIKS